MGEEGKLTDHVYHWLVDSFLQAPGPISKSSEEKMSDTQDLKKFMEMCTLRKKTIHGFQEYLLVTFSMRFWSTLIQNLETVVNKIGFDLVLENIRNYSGKSRLCPALNVVKK